MQRSEKQLWVATSLLVAFGLRIYALAAQSLWNDEGTSIALASRSLAAIADGAAKDIHPPLYYVLLHYWMSLAGQTEFAVRLLSVVAGVLLVAVAFRIAAHLFGEATGVLAAFLCAASPLLVYYSQETRMYIWLALWGALSMLGMMRIGGWGLGIRDWRLGNRGLAIGRSRRFSGLDGSGWLLYIGATIAMLYTHYFAPALLLAENLIFGLGWLLSLHRVSSVPSSHPISNPHSPIPTPQSRPGDRRGGDHEGGDHKGGDHKGTPLPPNFQSPISNPHSPFRTMACWLVGQLVIVTAFAPWYLFAGNQLAAWPAISEPFDLPMLVWRVLNAFSVGLTPDPATSTAIVLALSLLALVGALPSRSAERNLDLAAVMLWLAVPIGVMYAVSLSRPAYNAKFLLLAVPPFLMLAANGVARLFAGLQRLSRQREQAFGSFRLLFAGALVLAAIGATPSLDNYYADPHYARDDYRAILARIDAAARPGDGILVNAIGQIDVVGYYHRGDQPLFLLPRMRPPDPGLTVADVDDMLARVRRLYAIYYATEQSDTRGIVEGRLAEKAFKALDEWHGNVRMALYGVAPMPRGPYHEIGARVGEEITLDGYWLDAERARGGDVLTLTLQWLPARAPTARYKVFVHLLDARGRIAAQRDGEPVADRRITTTWRAGERIADNYGVLIGRETPPGAYRLQVGMYRADDGSRLPIRGRDGQPIGDHLVLGTVSVE